MTINSTQDIIGKTEQEAINYLEENKIRYRIVAKNGEHYFVTMDVKPGRCNLHIQNDLVAKITFG